MENYPEKMGDIVLGYDNVCGLASTCERRKDFSEASQAVNDLKKVHDRLHRVGHVSEACRNEYNIDRTLKGIKKYSDYRRWNTQCCEQVFSYFSNFPRLFHHSNETWAPIWAALLFHFKNLKTEEVLRNTTRVSV